MHASRKRRPTVLFWAIAVSAALHVIVLPFLRLPASASQPPQSQRITQDAPHHPLPIATPKPTPPPTPPPTPQPHVRHVVPRVTPALSRRTPRARVVAHVPHTRTNDPVEPVEPIAPVGPVGPVDPVASAGPGTATAGPAVAPVATPEPEPTVAPSICAEPDREARVVQVVTPDRPSAAAALGAYGSVDVRIGLSAEGAVVETAIQHSSGFAMLDNAAREAAARASYAPAVEHCHPVAGTYLYRVDFSE